MTDLNAQLLLLNQISRKSVALYHRFALTAGISDSALGVLYALLETQSPCSQYDLCNEWLIPKQTINTTVAALQKKGLVFLSPIPGTRNKKSLALTDAGRAFVNATVRQLREAELDALGEMTDEEREIYVRLNCKYNQALTERLDDFLADRNQQQEVPS